MIYIAIANLKKVVVQTEKNEDEWINKILSDDYTNFNFLTKKYYVDQNLKMGTDKSPKYFDIQNLGIFVTRLGAGNDFYYRQQTGFSPGIVLTPAMCNLSSFKGYNILEAMNTGKSNCILPNCVGYAVSRSMEVWAIAYKLGYIYLKGGSYYRKSNSGIEVKINGGTKVANDKITITPQGLNPFKNITIKSPAYFFDCWPSNNSGYSKAEFNHSTGTISSSAIKAGNILCWSNKGHPTSGPNSGSGHVAFIEDVIKVPGQTYPDIIISDSYYGHDGIKEPIKIQKLSWDGKGKGTGYKDSDKRVFRGIVITPSSQLLSNNWASTAPVGAKDYKEYFDENDIAIGNAISENSGLLLGLGGLFTSNVLITKSFDVGDTVIVKLLGYTTPTGNKTINYIKTRGKVVEVNPLYKHVYGVSIDGSSKPTLYLDADGVVEG